jgi:hypothetical protein
MIRGWWAGVLSLMLEACVHLNGEQRVESRSQQAQNLIQSFTDHSASADLIQNDAPRVAGEEVKLKSATLPQTLLVPMSYHTEGNQSFLQVLDNLSVLLNIPLNAHELGVMPLLASSVSSAASNLMAPSLAGLSSTVHAQPTPGSWIETLASTPVNLHYQGTAKGLMDELARRINASWRFNAISQSVEFFSFDTQVLSLSLPPGVKRVSAGIALSGVSGGASGVSSGAGAGSGSLSPSAGNVAVTQSLSVNPWASIMQGIQSILSEGANANHVLGSPGTGASSALHAGESGFANDTGNSSAALGGASAAGNALSASLSAGSSNGLAIANPELGLITVTAKPAHLARIAHYVDAINERFAHNVLIDVKIFSVSLDAQHSLGFGLNVLYKPLTALGVSVTTPAPLQAGTDTPGILTLSPSSASSRWSGSSVVAQALSQFGKVALQKQGQVLAVNGQPSPIQVANEITYVTSSTTTTTANVGTSVTQNTGTVVVGFTANFLPLILGDHRILLSYQMQISSLASPLTPNAQGIQTPNISSQSLQQQAFLNDGQAIVLFGFDEQSDGVSQAVDLVGASRASTQSRQMVVIVVEVNAGFKHA